MNEEQTSVSRGRSLPSLAAQAARADLANRRRQRPLIKPRNYRAIHGSCNLFLLSGLIRDEFRILVFEVDDWLNLLRW